MKKVLLCLVLVLVFQLPTSSAIGQAFPITSTTQTTHGDLIRTETTVQVDADPLNTFVMYRLRRNLPVTKLRGSMILVPGLLNSYPGFYEFHEAGQTLADSLAGKLARKNVDVWGISPRETRVQAGQCTGASCPAIRNWGMQVLLEDIDYVRTQVNAQHPGKKPVVGGFSLGALASIGTINQHPGDYRAALLWEGSLYTADPATIARNQGFCAALEGALANPVGPWWDESNGPGIRQLATAALANPTGPERETLFTLLTNPSVAPNFPTDTYVQLSGNQATRTYSHADELGRLYPSLQQFTDIFPLRAVRDVNCALAGETTFTNNLSAFSGKVLMLKSDRAFGPLMDELATLLTNATVRSEGGPVFGHVERFTHRSHETVQDAVIVDWLRRSVF